jgi:alkylhydroperoxidase family enzyme
MRKRSGASRAACRRSWRIVPAMLKNFLGFYGSVGRSLERRIYEMVYIRVSMINGCNY